MTLNLETATKRELLKLINGIFFFSALFSVISVLVSQKFIPQFLIEVGQSEISLTKYIFDLLQIILMMIIYLRLLTYEEFKFGTGAKIGLIFMMLNLLIPTFINVLYIFCSFDSTYMYYSLIHGCCFLLYMIGIIMFIKRCDIDTKLKRFIKWTPFISLILSTVITYAGILKYENGIFIQNIVFAAMEIAFFLIINKMSRNELKMA